ncbi:hypothetical protein HDU89_008531 [Geranomyces variabilis]|nr:hypothetical protein HDU89_008531 [Geranomyces variabilis]
MLPLTDDYDPRWTETSAAYQQYMQRKLYGPARENRFLPHSNAEAGDHKSPYADIPLPKWRTTMQDEYPRKRAEPSSRMDSSDPTKSHFQIGDPDKQTETISRSHSDFTAPEMPPRIDGKEISKRDHMYPPIYFDEDAVTGNRSTYQSTFAAHHPPRRRILPHKKTHTNIVLGTSQSGYTTTAQDALPARVPDTQKQTFEKLREWTPAMEDGGGDRWESTTKNAYGVPLNVDYVNASAGADRAAHFTLGTLPEEGRDTSTTYSRSFLPHDAQAAAASVRVPVPKEKSRVLDERDGVKWSSVYGETYQGKPSAPVVIEKPRTMDTAISFGSYAGGTQPTTRSSYQPPDGPAVRHYRRVTSPSRNPLPTTDEDRTTPQRNAMPMVFDANSYRERRRVAKDAAGKVRGSAVFRFADGDNIPHVPAVVVTRMDAAGLPTRPRSANTFGANTPPSYTTSTQAYGNFSQEAANRGRGVRPPSQFTRPPIPLDSGTGAAVSVTHACHIEPTSMRYMKPICGL